MAELLTWDNEMTYEELRAAVAKHRAPESVTSYGEVIAARLASYTPDEVRAFIAQCGNDTDLMQEVLDTLDAAGEALEGRAQLVRTAQARIFMVDLVDNPEAS